MPRDDRAGNSTMTVRGLFLSLMLLAISALFAGCFTRSFEDVQPGIAERGHYIANVPFVHQGDYDCGPAALASVFAFLEQPVDISQIATKVYVAKLHGTLPMDLENYAKAQGFPVAASRGSVKALQSLVQNDRPVICLLDLGYGRYKHPHYVLVIGFDEGNRLYIMHNGVQPNHTMSYADFETAWSRTGYWMLVVTQKASR